MTLFAASRARRPRNPGGGSPVATATSPGRRRGSTRPVTPRRRQAPSAVARGEASARRPLWGAAPVESDLIVGYQRDRYHRVAGAASVGDLLVDANMSLVRRAARSARARALGHDDVQQAATLGLLIALRKFRPTGGAPFAAYAHHWIRKEVQRAVASGGHPLTIPANDGSALRAIAAAAAERPRASDLELAAELDLPEAKVKALRVVVDTTTHDRILEPVTDDPTEDVARRLGVTTALQVLDPTVREVVRLRYGFDGAEPRTHRQIARTLSISDFTVRRRLQRAHEQLARHLV